MMLRSIGAMVALLGAAGPALACKCAVTARDQAIASTPVVFEGRVVNIETQGKEQLTTFAVVRAIKGLQGRDRIKVKSRTVSAACGYDFREAPKKLLVGGEAAADGSVSVRRCTMHNLNH